RVGGGGGGARGAGAGGVGAPAGRARVDLLEHLRAQPGPRELASPAFPRPPVELADPLAPGGIAHDDELPRLGVLGAGGVRRRLEHLLDELVGDGFVAECAVRALRADDREEVPLLAHAHPSPRRRNVSTYMLRGSGVLPHASQVAVPGSPMRAETSGVMVRNALSGSPVSIS